MPGIAEKLKSRQRTRVVGDRKMSDADLNRRALQFAGMSEPAPMSNTEMGLRLDRGQDIEDIEAKAIERSYESIGTGGRIEKYANGALEWVPNGEGDVPQAPTGDVFFDPIAEEQARMKRDARMKQMLTQLKGTKGQMSDRDLRILQGGARKKFARGGAVRKFQTGGLAAVTDLEEEEEFFDPSSVTGTEELIPDPAPDPIAELRKMATMTKDDAMARLRQSRETLAARRTKQEKRAEQDRWLALAQGMLSPTQTGAFGENVGMAAENLRGANALTFEQEQAIAEEEERMLFREYEIAGDYFDSLANLEGFKSTSRARVVSSITVMDPRDQEKVDAGLMRASEAKRVSLSTVMMPNGDTHSEVETVDDIPYDEGGIPYTIVDPRKVPAQAAAQKTAEQIASEAAKVQFAVAKKGMDAIPMVTRLQRAYALLQGLDEDTSGLNEKMRQVAQWAGISEIITDNVELATLHKMFGAQILQDLRLLTGSKTDFEYTKVEQQNARLGASVAENMGIIDEHMFMLNEMVDKGEYAAQRMEKGPGTEEKGFMLEQYLNHRKSQAEAAASYDAETRKAPESRLEELIENVLLNEGNAEEQKDHIDMFREYYDIPPEVELILRKAGAAI